MRDLDRLIQQAARHVESGRRIVQQQKNLVESGPSLPGSCDLLGVFERTQEIFESDLHRLLKERDRS
jgi:hypothetical protein